MLKCFEKIDWKKTGIFAGGVLFGTAGIKEAAEKTETAENTEE